MAVLQPAVEYRRAKDGYMATACRTRLAGLPFVLAAARTRGRPLVVPDHRHALRPGTANRRQLVARGGDRRRLSCLLLLPRQPGTQDRMGCADALAAARGPAAGRRSLALRHRRHADQALRTLCRRCR